MDKPNVIVIMSDEMKANALSLYGNSFCPTPNLERLAKQGVLFQNAFTPHPLCVPARVALWTSQYPHHNGANLNQTFMPDKIPHAFKIWKDAGYHTGLIGKNHCFNLKDDFDLFDVFCEIMHRGPEPDSITKGMAWQASPEDIKKAHSVRRSMPFQSDLYSYAITNFPEEHYSTGMITKQVVQYLKEFGDKPFALWVSYPDPHAPYEASARYVPQEMVPEAAIRPIEKREMPGAPERNRVLREIMGVDNENPDDLRRHLAIYYGMIRFIDDGVGEILDALEKFDLCKNTIVVFCSDHGDLTGEHGMIEKGGLFYDCLTQVPLIVAAGSQNGAINKVDHSMVNLVDVVPTLLTLQGLEIPNSMRGQPLPTLTPAKPREFTFSEYGAGGPPFTMEDLKKCKKTHGRGALMETLIRRETEGCRKMVRSAGWKYVHDPRGDLDELYDMINDPLELSNRAEDPVCKAEKARLHAVLEEWMRS